MSARDGLLERLTASFEDDGPYRCRGCDASFGVQHHVCPDCGSYGVDRATWL